MALSDWEFRDARRRLSEVIDPAKSQGPQRITHRNEAYWIITDREYQRLIGQRSSLKRLLLDGPSLEWLTLARDPSPMRHS